MQLKYRLKLIILEKKIYYKYKYINKLYQI
jgi:hypothetical protein